MIVKHFEIKNKIKPDNNYFLLYGNNEGLIEETIEQNIKPNLGGKILRYEEKEILGNLENFKEEAQNKSFFEDKKLIIISRITDKFLLLIEELIKKNISDLSIILKSSVLEKKSKIRNFFEKSKETICIPFYEDNNQTLSLIIRNFLKEKKIRLSQENINLIIEKSRGNRISLKNELTKLESFSKTQKEIKTENIIKLINLSENYNVSELVDNSLAKNKRKTITILNENNFAQEDCILISRIFLQKLKRLIKIQSDIQNNNKNIESAIISYKPPIFWKEKEIIKNQIKMLSFKKLEELLIKTNKIEYLIKKNPNISLNIITDFILEQAI